MDASNDPNAWDIESIISDAEPAEGTITICVKGSLRAEYDRISDQLNDEAKTVTSLAGGGPATELATCLEDLRQQMQQYLRTFHLRAVTPRKRWRDLVAKRPVKKPGMSDEDYLDLYHPWVCRIVAATVVTPTCTPEQIERLADKISDGDWKALSNRAWALNDDGSEIPFSVAASVLTRSSGATSKQPETSTNPDHGSLAGSPESSPSTSTTEKAASSAPSRPRSRSGPKRTTTS